MKFKLLLTALSLFIFSTGSMASVATPVEDDLQVVIIRLSPLEPARYMQYASPANANPKKRLEVIKKNLNLVEKNITNAKEFIAEVDEYLKLAEADLKNYKDEIPVAKAKQEKWKKILAADLTGYEKLQKAYAAVQKQITGKKIRKGKSIKKGVKKIHKALKARKLALPAGAATAALKAAKAGPVSEENFCKNYGRYAGCVRLGDCSNSCSSRKGCWIDNSKNCAYQPPIARTACWCK